MYANWYIYKPAWEERMRFTDLTAAFEEMEYMVKTTGCTFRVVHSGTRSKSYHVVQKSGSAKVPFLIAEPTPHTSEVQLETKAQTR